MKNKYLLASLAMVAFAAVAFSSVTAQAADTADNGQTIVQKIAERFKLNENDVQQVFNENRSARQAQMGQKFDDRLNQAVTDKKITLDQKDKIQAKHKEIQADRQKNIDTFRNLTPEEKRADREKKRTEMDQWAKDNGIDNDYFMGMGSGAGKGGRGGMHMR